MPPTPAFGRYVPTHAAPRSAPKALLAVPLALAICAGQAGPAFATEPTTERTEASSTAPGAEQRAAAAISAGRADAEAQAAAAVKKEAAAQVKAQAAAAAKAQAAQAAAEKAAAKQEAAEAEKAGRAEAKQQAAEAKKADKAEKDAAKQDAAEAKKADKAEDKQEAAEAAKADKAEKDEAKQDAAEKKAEKDEPEGGNGAKDDEEPKGNNVKKDDKNNKSDEGDKDNRGDDAVVTASSADGLTVTVRSTKALSNVVLRFCDGTTQKFDGLSGNEVTFSGTGRNDGKLIDGVFIKSGNNASGAGPGFGEFVDVTDCPTTAEASDDSDKAPKGGGETTTDEDVETVDKTPTAPNEQSDDEQKDAPAAPGAPVDSDRDTDAEVPVNAEVPADNEADVDVPVNTEVPTDTEADVEVLPTTPTDRAPVADSPATTGVAVLPATPVDRAPAENRVTAAPASGRQTAQGAPVQVEAGRVSAQSSTASRTVAAPAQLPFTGNDTGTLLGSGLGLLLVGFMGQLLGRRRYTPLHAAA